MTTPPNTATSTGLSYPLTTGAWIPVLDHDAGARSVGIAEALVRAHRLSLTTRPQESAVLTRVLLAVLDAACGPRDQAAWDVLWAAETLPEPEITAYLELWGGRLDLLDPERPAFQCGALSEFPRGPEVLRPSFLAGGAGEWFDPALRHAASAPAWEPGEAAVALLVLLGFDVGGIKRKAGPDGGQTYGALLGPVAAVTHLQVSGPTLKDTLLLNLPPRPRAEGDAPVWERDDAPPGNRERAPAGRMDLWTWPSRRMRLHARPTSAGASAVEVDQVAWHDGDRHRAYWESAVVHDPMTAWGVREDRQLPAAALPLPLVGPDKLDAPWRLGRLIDPDDTAFSRSVEHARAAAERGVLDPDTVLTLHTATTQHGNQHRTTIAAIGAAETRIRARVLADPDLCRAAGLAARYAEVSVEKVRTAMRAELRFRARAEVTGVGGLADAWEEFLETLPEVERARRDWGRAVREELDRQIDLLPGGPSSQLAKERMRAAYRMVRFAAHTKNRQDADAGGDEATADEPAPNTRRRRAGRRTAARPADGLPQAARYTAWGETKSANQWAQDPRCIPSANTLAKRLAAGWDPELALTEPTQRGRPRKAPIADVPEPTEAVALDDNPEEGTE